MNDEIKQEWKKNLTSGKFTQGKGYLREWNFATKQWEYCCLGVLCEQSGLGKWTEKSAGNGHRLVSSYLGATQYLPDEVAKWAGIAPTNGNEPGVQTELAEQNDEEHSFEEIAEGMDEVLERFEIESSQEAS